MAEFTKNQLDNITEIAELSDVFSEGYWDALKMRLGWDTNGGASEITQDKIDAVPALAGLTAAQVINAVTTIDLVKTTLTEGHLQNLLTMAKYRTGR